MEKNQNKIIEVRDLKVYYPIKRGSMLKKTGYVKAVDGISFEIKHGETLGLVGESGCGKSTTGRAILRLLRINAGLVLFQGKDISTISKNDMRYIRKKMQLIFQDPYASLNPRMTVGDTLEEVLYVHNLGGKEERRKKVEELIEMVGLSKNHISRYPHEFSGGQRQRIVTARALSVNPSFIVCDEPVSALDVSIQSQIINLLDELQEKFKLTYLFISHDLSVVKHTSNRIAVMYLGKIVEVAESDELFSRPQHPYTKALLSAIPVCNPEIRRQKILLEGDTPSPVNPPEGCRFHDRCISAKPICSLEEPTSVDIGGGHIVSCHLISKEKNKGGSVNE